MVVIKKKIVETQAGVYSTNNKNTLMLCCPVKRAAFLTQRGATVPKEVKEDDPSPCIDCQYWGLCKAKLKACTQYYTWVSTGRNDNTPANTPTRKIYRKIFMEG